MKPLRHWYVMVKWIPDGEPQTVVRRWTHKNAVAVALRAYEVYVNSGMAWVNGPFPQEVTDIQQAWLSLDLEARAWLAEIKPHSLYMAIKWSGALGNVDLLEDMWERVDNQDKWALRTHTPELYRAIVIYIARYRCGSSE